MKMETATSTMYGFFYNPMTEESSAGLESLHRTRQGAENALKLHKEKEHKKWKQRMKEYKAIMPEEVYKEYKRTSPFGQFQAWFVEDIQVQD